MDSYEILKSNWTDLEIRFQPKLLLNFSFPSIFREKKYLTKKILSLSTDLYTKLYIFQNAQDFLYVICINQMRIE